MSDARWSAQPEAALAPATAHIAALRFYPVKSAAGLSLQSARLTTRGLADDRRWMVATPQGQFLTQRVLPRLALLHPRLGHRELVLSAAGHQPLRVPLSPSVPQRVVSVNVWKDRCPALDEGNAAAAWLEALLEQPCRLVRFSGGHRRCSSRTWTAPFEATIRFADAFPLLIISAASLADLNARLGRELPLECFRPNLVLDGLEPYAEDRIDELYGGALRLKLIKPCTRCRITGTDQQTGEAGGEEPLRLLRSYRYDRELHGVTFGYNAIIAGGSGSLLRCGQTLQVRWKAQPAVRSLASG